MYRFGDLGSKLGCDSRKWGLSGIPCIHVINCICPNKKKAKDYISDYYREYNIAIYFCCHFLYFPIYMFYCVCIRMQEGHLYEDLFTYHFPNKWSTTLAYTWTVSNESTIHVKGNWSSQKF